MCGILQNGFKQDQMRLNRATVWGHYAKKHYLYIMQKNNYTGNKNDF